MATERDIIPLPTRLNREHLAIVALGLALRNGLGAVTVDEIARVGRVSPDVVRNVFGSAAEAVLAARRPRVTALQHAIAARPAEETPMQAVRRGTVDLVRSLPDRHVDLLRRLARLASSPSLRVAVAEEQRLLEQDLRAAVAGRGSAEHRGVLVPVIAGIAALALRTAIERWIADDDASATRLAQHIEGAFAQFHGSPSTLPLAYA